MAQSKKKIKNKNRKIKKIKKIKNQIYTEIEIFKNLVWSKASIRFFFGFLHFRITFFILKILFLYQHFFIVQKDFSVVHVNINIFCFFYSLERSCYLSRTFF